MAFWFRCTDLLLMYPSKIWQMPWHSALYSKFRFMTGFCDSIHVFSIAEIKLYLKYNLNISVWNQPLYKKSEDRRLFLFRLIQMCILTFRKCIESIRNGDFNTHLPFFFAICMSQHVLLCGLSRLPLTDQHQLSESKGKVYSISLL